jgi:CRP-like cAMP-binding protein
MDNVDLEGIPLFAELTPEERARIAAVSRPLHWDVGEMVLREGEFAFDLYAIKQGAAEVRRSGEPVGVLGAGDFFGELGIAPLDASRWSRRRTASVVVTAPTDAIAIPGADVRSLSDAIPKLRDALRVAASARRPAESVP